MSGRPPLGGAEEQPRGASDGRVEDPAGGSSARVEPAPPARSEPRRRARGRARARVRRRRKADPIKPWAKRLRQGRPGLVEFVLEGVESLYGRPVWQRVHDPTSELVLTILSQNSADVNAEHAFEALRVAYPGVTAEQGARADEGAATHPGEVADVHAAATGLGPSGDKANRPGWGGSGLARAVAPDWGAVELAPLDELVDVIRPGGLANQKAPVIQAALRHLRETRGGYSLEFLAQMPPLEARAWLMGIPGIGKKTASVVLLFSFGMPLMPVDRHVERVSKRIGLLPPRVGADEAHDRYLALIDPALSYRTHVGLITHGRRTCVARVPACDRCPIAPRCRFVDRRAP